MAASRREPGRAGGVGVHVGGDLESLPPRRFYLADDLVHLRPVRLAGRFQVIDLRGQAGLTADPDQFVDRFEQAVALAAHVRDVLAAVLRRHLAQLDELLGAGVRGRRVDQRRSDPERARFHFPAHELPHAIELLRRRLLVFESNHVLADGRGAEVRRDVLRHAAVFEILQILRQRRPGDLVLRDRPSARRRASSSRASAGPSSCLRRRSGS